MLKKMILLTTTFILLFSCGSGKGTLAFTANGEEFIAEGFTSKEGWDLSFEKVLVNLTGVEAYHPEISDLSVTIDEDYLVDLKDSFGPEPSVSVTSVKKVPAGNYQSLRFSLKQMSSGPHKGYSVVLSGTARKEGETLPFLIKISEELTFDGREGYVGDTIKGLVEPGQASSVEMTFHFDHIFGDASSGPEEHVNSHSPGFDLFLDYKKEGRIEVTQEEMKSHESYTLLMGAIESLGHLGEGHCEVIR